MRCSGTLSHIRRVVLSKCLRSSDFMEHRTRDDPPRTPPADTNAACVCVRPFIGLRSALCVQHTMIRYEWHASHSQAACIHASAHRCYRCRENPLAPPATLRGNNRHDDERHASALSTRSPASTFSAYVQCDECVCCVCGLCVLCALRTSERLTDKRRCRIAECIAGKR